jgi:hypothetical protein
MRAKARGHVRCAPRRLPQAPAAHPLPKRGPEEDFAGAAVRGLAVDHRVASRHRHRHGSRKQLLRWLMRLASLSSGSATSRDTPRLARDRGTAGLRMPPTVHARSGQHAERLWEPPRSTGLVGARVSAHQRLTRGGCPSAANAVSEASSAAPTSLSTGGDPRAARAARSGARRAARSAPLHRRPAFEQAHHSAPTQTPARTTHKNPRSSTHPPPSSPPTITPKPEGVPK